MLIDQLLDAQKIAYLLTDQQLKIQEWAGYAALLPDDLAVQADMTDLLPELLGSEEVLHDVINGQLPDFQMEGLNREQADGEVHYLNLLFVPHGEQQLLVLLSDTTEWLQNQQTLTQQRNELDLLQSRLAETNAQMDFLLKHYVPREVSRALLEKRIAPKLGGELREITVLFADLRDFTSLSETQSPDQTIEMLHVCMDMASTAIAESGGVVVNFMGDAVMAVFNAPNEQPDHALRAVKAGLAMQESFALYREDDSCEHPAIHFGVGINSGIALVGNMGAMNQYQYTAIGDDVNVASRICSYARAGEVLIGDKTYQYVRPKVMSRSLEPVKLKGKSQLVKVHQVFEMLPENEKGYA